MHIIYSISIDTKRVMDLIKKQQRITVFAGIGMLILILDSHTVLLSALEGINLCLYTVIPSLFPFLVISGIITGNIGSQSKNTFLKFEKVLGIPRGASAVVLLGLLSGYPNGAQNIHQIYIEEKISKKDAERMLPICNNAGPAFIFGMISTLFTNVWIPWILWTIQILSTLFLSVILPEKSKSALKYNHPQTGSIITSLQTATRSMVYICSWVIMFRIILGVMELRLLKVLPTFVKILICGFFELTNGILALNLIENEAVRFILVSLFLSIGGLCVLLQTSSVAENLCLKKYCMGKALHAAISLTLSVFAIPCLFFSEYISISVLTVAMVFIILLLSFILIFKKTVAIHKKVLYNDKKYDIEVLL